MGFFVGGEKSLLLSNFGSELSEKRVKNPVKQYDFRVKRENHVSRDFSLVFHEILTQNIDIFMGSDPASSVGTIPKKCNFFF